MPSLFRPLLRLACIFVCGALAVSARADTPLAILDQARAYLGPEAALTAVKTLRMVGKLEVGDSGSAESEPAKLEILFQQPYKQRITATTAKQVEVTALDGFDAWQRVADPADSTNWQVALLGPDQIKRLRANTFENLAFYRGLETQGGKIEDRGLVTVDKVPCRQIAFIHAPDIVFIRSFELSTGRLVLTQTDSGTQIREEGEIKVAGLHFPQRIITTAQLADGTTRTIRVTFSTIEVNPVIDPATFAIPTLTP